MWERAASAIPSRTLSGSDSTAPTVPGGEPASVTRPDVHVHAPAVVADATDAQVGFHPRADGCVECDARPASGLHDGSPD